jgi:hypothetical protein
MDMAARAGDSPGEVAELARWGPHPTWRLTPTSLDFACGCGARRFRTLYGARPSDPIIFRGLPEQAVYVRACATHEARVNDYVHFQGFTDLAQWRAHRWRELTGESWAA